MSIAILILVPLVSRAQSSAHLRISASAVAAGDSIGACRFDSAIRRYGSGASGSATPDDTLHVDVYADSTFNVLAVPRTPLQVMAGDLRLRDIGKGDSSVTLTATGAGLADRVITVRRADATSLLCSDMPFPNLSPGYTIRGFTTHTDIIASGEVSNALRTGASNAPATGSLGFHHLSYPMEGVPPTHFPLTRIPVSSEDLRAVISVASAVDSITGNSGGNFAQAILLPTIAPNSGWKSVDLEYFPSHMYGRRHQMFGPAFRITAGESRWAPDSLAPSKGHFPTKVAVLIAFDARVRWVAINRVSQSDNNSLSFTLDGGYIQRSLSGDASSDTALVHAALGEVRTRFSGWAVGTYLRLRQVTAYADFQCLSCKLGPVFGRSGSKIESLEGLQPIIGFRFEAPFFTVTP